MQCVANGLQESKDRLIADVVYAVLSVEIGYTALWLGMSVYATLNIWLIRPLP